MEDINEEFDHHGVKGMRWGRRKQRASGYTDKQYAQDTAIYSKSGARRINKRIRDQGYGVKGARSQEKTLHDAAVKNSKIGKQAGKGVGMVLGGVAAGLASDSIGRVGSQAVYSLTKNLTMSSTLRRMSKTVEGKAAIASGGAFVGKTIGQIAGEKIPLAALGYKR